ncbi:ABC transporter permease [Sabulicella rubraurantiaca]|uniref:ABC transporter permease n=1 Tax=Sabulicella rubraurantiaca TaxID=2811429 RepID=UPI001A95B7AE|nr:ABC transporter permease [Sabulicella rubraurantiaca]
MNAAVRQSLLRSALAVIGFLAIWEVAGRTVFIPAVLPAPSVILGEAWSRAASGLLGVDVAMSASRIIVGFLAGSLLGAGLGLLFGAVEPVRRAFEPIVQFFRFIPPIAWLTPVLIWFGIGEMGKWVLITYTTTFMVLLNTLAGFAEPQRDRMRAARVFGAGPWRAFWHVRLPATVPWILAGMRIGMGNSFQTLIVAEMLASNEGLGHLILNSRIQLSTERMFVGILGIAVLGIAADLGFRALTRRLFSRHRLGW